MIYKTTRFGEIDVPGEKVLFFKEGVIGFENLHEFVILKHRPTSSFFWLQSLENSELAFSMLFPFEFVPSYSPLIHKEDLDCLEAAEQKNLEIYSMVVIPKDPALMTINLLSPVVVNPANQKGRQVVLLDSNYSVNHKLVPDTLKVAGNNTCPGG
ncbi:MAG: flagellar assembly protein FliW [Candidatus Aureabacteria bacterium]|nr:flagellar assembly protein FliW [Candidatus Auribacterota bacterium]